MGDGQARMAPETVLHVIPFGQPRGAQRYARALVDVLDSPDSRHMLLTLFEGDDDSLQADLALDVSRGLPRRLGLDPRVLWRLRRVLRRLRPEIVVAHGGEPAKYLALAAPRSLETVYLKIGTEHPKMTRAISGFAYRFSTSRADRIVAVSEAAAVEVQALVPSIRDRVRVIPNGRDPEVYKPASQQGAGGATRLVWVGELDPTKRPEWFIEVVRVLKAEGREIVAKLVGDGRLSESLAAPAARVGVEMLGRRDDMPSILADSDVLIFTGMPPEGMPGVLIEAGLCALPAVATRVPGAEEVIDDGRTGAIVGVDDFDALLKSLRALLDDQSARQRMGAEARRRCVERFSFDATASRWGDVFNELMTADPGPA